MELLLYDDLDKKQIIFEYKKKINNAKNRNKLTHDFCQKIPNVFKIYFTAK